MLHRLPIKDGLVGDCLLPGCVCVMLCCVAVVLVTCGDGRERLFRRFVRPPLQLGGDEHRDGFWGKRRGSANAVWVCMPGLRRVGTDIW